MILHDASATDWLTRRGLAAEGPATVVVDEFAQEEVALTRVWHSPVRGRLRAPRGAVVVVLQLDAAVEIAPSGGGGSSITAGGAFALSGGQQVVIVTTEPSARIELTLPASGELASLPTDRLPAVSWPSEEPGWARAAMISLSNVVLNLGVEAELPDFDRFATALHATAAAFLRSSYAPPVVEPWSRALTQRADLVIARTAGDRRFSVTALAEELGVTSTHLSRAFREAGRPSPRQVIREHRRAIALSLLGGSDLDRARLDADRLARLSGFGSSDSLRRALREG